MKVVVILPTYNEKANIEKMIPLLEEEILPQIKHHHVAILIVDDNSPDGTAEIVKNFMHKWKNISLLSGEKKGLGAAYVRGMHYAMNEMGADAVMEFDSDFQHNPHDIPRLVHAMDEGADYVIGSRYVPGGSIPKEWGMDRKFLSVFGSLFTRIVWLNFKIHDMTSGFKLTKTSFLKKVDLDHLLSYQFAYKMHILHEVVKQGAKVKEVPIAFLEREKGASKISKKDQFDSLYVVVRLAINDRKRVIKFLFVGGTGFLIQVLIQESTIRLGLTMVLAIGLSSLISLFTPHSDINSLSQGIGAGFGAEGAILSNFFFNNFWTFSDTTHMKETSNFFVRLIKFNLTSFASIFVQFFAVWIGVKLLGNNIPVGTWLIPVRILILFPTIIFIVIPLNYFIYNKIIWKTQYLKKK
jgi:dolichol-phosphate mannosyltransferase